VDLGRPSFEAFIADYFDDGIALIECSAGHKTALVMQSQKFEMLLDSGAAALLEGFTLEACASFAAALERFYEFSLHAAGLRPPPCTVVRETEFCGLRLAGDFRRRTRANGRNSVRRLRRQPTGIARFMSEMRIRGARKGAGRDGARRSWAGQ